MKLGGNGKRHEQPVPSEKLKNSQVALGSTKIPSPKTSHSLSPNMLECSSTGHDLIGAGAGELKSGLDNGLHTGIA